MAETFTCASCGWTFETSWSDEEACAESRDAFGVDIHQDPTMAVVCDDCYKAMTTAIPPRASRRRDRERAQT